MTTSVKGFAITSGVILIAFAAVFALAAVNTIIYAVMTPEPVLEIESEFQENLITQVD